MCAHAGFKRCKRYYYMLIWELSFRGKNVFYSLEIICSKIQPIIMELIIFCLSSDTAVSCNHIYFSAVFLLALMPLGAPLSAGVVSHRCADFSLSVTFF